MERMLTLDDETFAKLLIKSKLIEGAEDPWKHSTYNYMVVSVYKHITRHAFSYCEEVVGACPISPLPYAAQHGPFIFRSQLDCVFKGTNKIFDIKTRASRHIRVNMTDYK